MRGTNFWCSWIVAVLLTTPWLGAAEPDGKVLLKDSFESGDDVPQGWEQGGPVPGVKYVYDRRLASDGKRSLSLQKSANRYFPIAGWFKAVDYDGQHRALKVAVKVKASKVTKAIVDAQFYDANGQMLNHEWLAYIGQKEDNDPVATHNWKTYEGAAEIPAGTKRIAIALQIYGPGSVWFDELRAESADSVASTSAAAPTTSNADNSSADNETSAEAEIPSPVDVKCGSGAVAQYLLVPPADSAKKPTTGYPLLLVLPGGDGSAEFHPFVRRIQKDALKGEFVVAQPIAPFHIVWPTKGGRVKLPTTEEAIDAIIADVTQRYPIDRKQVYALAWSSSGPAIYATLLAEKSPLAGAMIAMSVFKPDELPPLANAAGRRIYLLHSQADKVCPYRMASQAQDQLKSAGAAVTLVDYDGGHGWHGPVFEQIRTGIRWLQQTP